MAVEKLTRADVKEMNKEDLGAWCIDNGQTEWFYKQTQLTEKVPVYPKKEHVITRGKNKGKTKLVDDTSKEPIEYVTKPISFAKIKENFIDEFLGIPKAKKEMTVAEYAKMLYESHKA